MRPLFRQERVAVSAGQFLDGLLVEERRKTGWMRAEAAGDRGPWRRQAILGRGHWDADALRDIVQDYVVEHLADDDAVLVVDETSFLKQGLASCGVGRQYTGSGAKSPKTRSVCSRPMLRATVTLSSIVPFTCRRLGQMIPPG
jgi:SRSO17 transposase